MASSSRKHSPKRATPSSPTSLAPARTLARRAALRALVESESSETPLASLLDHHNLDASSRPFARELASGTTRHRARLDYSLEPLLRKTLETLDAPVRNALRLALYERLVLETPAHVVADEYAGLMRGEKLKSAVGFVNAIARRLPDHWRPSPNREKTPAKFLAIEYSHPLWLVERWLARFGFEACEALLVANNTPAPLNLRVNTLRTNRDHVVGALRERGLSVQAGTISPDAIIVESHGGSPEQWPEWASGEIIAQDEGAQVVARVVSAPSGGTLFDLAAAPGGKSTHLAQLMNDSGKIFACDRAEGRLKLVRDNARRLQLQSITTLAGDAREATSAWRQTYGEADAVLLDAPCLGTGTLRRRPDAKWRKTPEQLGELVALQRELLDAAATLVKVGGVLVYSTCSLEPEENEEQARAFLARHPVWQLDTHVPEAAASLPPEVRNEHGFWQTMPGFTHPNGDGSGHLNSVGGSRPDGMFAARFVRLS